MKCDNCGFDHLHEEPVTRAFVMNGRVVVVEQVPAMVCDRCGDTTFSASVAEHLRVMVNEPQPEARPIPAELLRYEAA